MHFQLLIHCTFQNFKLNVDIFKGKLCGKMMTITVLQATFNNIDVCDHTI